jgi:hypothetical protein
MEPSHTPGARVYRENPDAEVRDDSALRYKNEDSK